MWGGTGEELSGAIQRKRRGRDKRKRQLKERERKGSLLIICNNAQLWGEGGWVNCCISFASQRRDWKIWAQYKLQVFPSQIMCCTPPPPSIHKPPFVLSFAVYVYSVSSVCFRWFNILSQWKCGRCASVHFHVWAQSCRSQVRSPGAEEQGEARISMQHPACLCCLWWGAEYQIFAGAATIFGHVVYSYQSVIALHSDNRVFNSLKKATFHICLELMASFLNLNLELLYRLCLFATTKPFLRCA